MVNTSQYLRANTANVYAGYDNQKFFDVCVDCLTSVEGVTLRILKGDADVGGIDEHQVRELCHIISERIGQSTIELIEGSLTSQADRYQSAYAVDTPFAIVAAIAGRGHWVMICRKSENICRYIDDGVEKRHRLGNGNLPKLS